MLDRLVAIDTLVRRPDATVSCVDTNGQVGGEVVTNGEHFVQGNRIPDISYRTDAPEEVVCPRVSTREGIAVVYLHNERDEPHKGFVPVATFLRRLAKREPNLSVTAYRANGRQTTISFNKWNRVTLSPKLQSHLSSLAAKKGGRSAAVVGFIASLAPLYVHEEREGVSCALSLQDGTLVFPIDESEWGEEIGRTRVQWQGDSSRESVIDGAMIATVALERYVRIHGSGEDEATIAAELWFMARHFRHKTGVSVYLPQLTEPPGRVSAFGRKAVEFGQGVLVNLFSKLVGV